MFLFSKSEENIQWVGRENVTFLPFIARDCTRYERKPCKE